MTIVEERLPSSSQLQNQMLYAPFIKQRDKLDKDIAELIACLLDTCLQLGHNRIARGLLVLTLSTLLG